MSKIELSKEQHDAALEELKKYFGRIFWPYRL